MTTNKISHKKISIIEKIRAGLSNSKLTIFEVSLIIGMKTETAGRYLNLMALSGEVMKYNFNNFPCSWGLSANHIELTTKKCTLCKCEKLVDEFSINRSIISGISSSCKSCINIKNKSYRLENKDRLKPIRDAKYIENIIEIRRIDRERYALNREKKKAMVARYRANHPDRAKKCVEAWKKRNPDRVRKNKENDYINNKEKYSAINLAWRKSHPEQCRENIARRRARILMAEGKFTAKDLKKLMISQRGKCVVCKKDIRTKYHADHIEPLSRGGSNDKFNIQLLCPKCNCQKHAKDPIDFMQSKGFLI